MQTSEQTKSHPGTDNRQVATSEIVCLVDDDPSVRKSVGRLLESEGFSVRTFGDPTVFLEYLATNPVSVAVLDIWMENMTGMELLAHLCARSPQTRVIFITGHEDSAAEATVTQAGVYAFFLKPFDDDKFLRAVHDAFKIAEAGPPTTPMSNANPLAA